MRHCDLLLVCLFLTGLPLPGRGQTPMREKIRAGAQARADGLKDGDYARVVDSMYPPYLETRGGHDAMLASYRAAKPQLEQAGVSFDAIEIGQAGEPVAAGDKLFAVVPQTIRMTGPKEKLEQVGYLLAISTDQGNTWSYLEGTGMSEQSLKQILPDLPPALKLPEYQPPKVTPSS